MSLIKRVRYVVVRNADEAIFCGLARHYKFKTVEQLGDTPLKTYLSENKAKAGFLSSWYGSKAEDFNNGTYSIVKVFEILESEDE